MDALLRALTYGKPLENVGVPDRGDLALRPHFERLGHLPCCDERGSIRAGLASVHGEREGSSMRIFDEAGRRAAALVLALCLCSAWAYATQRLLHTVALVRSTETIYFVQWAGGAALIALTARVAGRWRWAVGVPLLLVSALAGFLLWGLLALGPGSSPGIARGVLLGTFVIGPAILAIPVAVPRSPEKPGAPAAARRFPWKLYHREAWLWAGVLGMLVAVFFSFASPPAVENWRLRRIQRDVVPAAKNLVRTDVLTSEPVVWEGCGCAEVPGGWSEAARSGEQRPAPSAKVRLQFLPDLRYARKYGATGEAEGLRADAIRVFVRQPRLLSDQEVRNPEVVRPILLSGGLNPELVSRLRPDMTATYRGVTYRIVWNIRWPPHDVYARIDCSGVRSMASP